MKINRNADILNRIDDYCNEIDKTIERFGKEYDIFVEDSVYQNAVALCVVQIGELVRHFTDRFKENYNAIKWYKIIAFRNMIIHNYGEFDKKLLWETITLDIPNLKKYCSEILNQFESMNQECICEEQQQRLIMK